MFKTMFPYNMPVKKVTLEIKQKIKNNKKQKVLVASIIFVTGVILNIVVAEILIKIINKTFKPIETKFIDTNKFKYTGSCLDFLKSSYKGKSILSEITDLYVGVLFEEAMKQAALELGCIKEFLVIFIGAENTLYSIQPVLRKLAPTILKYEKQISDFAVKHGADKKSVQEVFNKLKEHGKNHDWNFIYYHIGHHEYKKHINRVLFDRWILGTLDHIIYTILHKLGFHDIAILYHFIWNALLGSLYSCIVLKKTRRSRQ